MATLHSITRALLGVTAACTMLAATTAAHAGIIGSFDPAFGPGIPNLGFRGTITLDVSSGCYASGGGYQFTGGTCQITAQTATINYYNATTGGPVLTTVMLPGSVFGDSYVIGAFFDPTTGQLAGFDTEDSNFFPVSVTDTNPLAPIDYTGRAMLLYFESGFLTPSFGDSERILSSFAGPSVATVGFGGAFLVDCGSIRGIEGCSRDPYNTSFPASLTFTAVPEPGSLALGLLGLVALSASRRRARRTTA